MIGHKRASLERFIYEQVIGPGISGYRFVSLQNEQLFDENLLQKPPIYYSTELINIVPAGVYSSGILFPVDKSKNDNDDLLTNAHEKEPVFDNDLSQIAGRENDEASIEEEDAIQIDQMYPNTMGITCCLNETVSNTRDVLIRIEARYYKKVDIRGDEFNENYGVLCECDSHKLSNFISGTIFSSRIIIRKLGLNTILLLQKVNAEELKEMKVLLRTLSESHLQILKQEINTFDFVSKAKGLSALKQGCYYELKNECLDVFKRDLLYNVSQKIEEIENFILHITDLIELNDSRSYGLWQSNPIYREISLPENIPSDLKGKKSYLYKDFSSLKDIYLYDLGGNRVASLSMNIQISRASRKNDGRIFFKAQLINTSTPFKKNKGDSRYYSTFNEEVNTRCFFGVRVSITSEHLIAYNEIDFRKVKDVYDEDDVTKFIYRQFKDYGVGHGCSVRWDQDKANITVSSEYIPKCDTPDVDTTPRKKSSIIKEGEEFISKPYLNSSKALEFKWLSTFSNSEDGDVIRELTAFINSYGSWITSKKEEYNSQPENIKRIAFQELQKCEKDKERMMKNLVEFLIGNENQNNLLSFRLMNSAMFMQLWHSVKVKEDKVQEVFELNFIAFDENFYALADDKLFDSKSAAWRPFQLAFILLNLDGIFKPKDDPKWIRRNEFVDLVWFPTGGGKTEAYLGIIAITIINRRLIHGAIGGGTAAIMRYTLRLLTLQQFQRATLVIMALELIRRWDKYELGKEPIFIGLWVGDNSLPNSLDNLLSEFQKLSEGKRSKIPYEYCPWCRSRLSPSNQKIADDGNTFHFNRLHLKCSNTKCSFSFARPTRVRKDQGPIPVSLCDEEIYQHPPALLFGTVDKFAQLAHKVNNDVKERHKDSRRIFGKGNWEEAKPENGYLTPDLIIQDELHLLLGPLGSSVALFESAIDQLCTRKDGTRPKVVSSTATTRNTDLQIMALFDRKVNIFPKPGVECDDSFFSFYKRRFTDTTGTGTEFISKRRYLGILPTGRTQIWMQMRLAAILMTHRALFEIEQLKDKSPIDFRYYSSFEKAMDYYHTVVSYFNSLKEVGKTESQIHSYILKEIRRVFNRVIRPHKLMHAFYTYSIRKAELTGRLSGEEVKNELAKVQTKWESALRFSNDNNGQIEIGQAPPDFVVATNMISVGIDVSRFNTILMNSMPRNIAEYIQASSRVARESLGLVLTIHHPFRARDISHYEKFIEFHEKMYSYVEPISITPFTKKAVERYLGLYLATMIRHTTRFINRNSASNISQMKDAEISQLISHLSNYFERRKDHLALADVDEQIKNLIQEKNVRIIRSWIEEAIKEWEQREIELRDVGKTLVFNNKRKTSSTNLSQEQLYVDIEEYEENIHSEKWQVPMSLRVIEPEAVLKIKLK